MTFFQLKFCTYVFLETMNDLAHSQVLAILNSKRFLQFTHFDTEEKLYALKMSNF